MRCHNGLHCGVVPGLPAVATGVLAVVSCLSIGLSAQGATIEFTDRTNFESSLPLGFFFNNFSTTPDAFILPVASVTGSGGTPTVGYTITAPTSGLGVFPDAGFKAIGNWELADNVVLAFTSGNVASAGGDIWLSDINGNRLAGNITVDFTGSSSLAQIVVPSTTTGTFGFAGITTTDGPISTMTLQSSTAGYLNITNVSVAVVPEPASVVLLGWGAAAGVAGIARRRRQSADRV